jgi:hypothetical protein
MKQLGLLSLFVICGWSGIYAQEGGGGEKAAKFTENAMKLRDSILFKVKPTEEPSKLSQLRTDARYSWHLAIVTTVFWVGETPAANNPVPNHSSAWDSNWARNYGGLDSPDGGSRRGYIPARFVPRQNPFYVALPYNDVTRGRTKPEAARVIPWFKEAFVRVGQTVLKSRWVAIRNGTRVAYAQWEDVGPFRSDHWQYVFGTERPRSNLNRGAGLDVSPAIRDYLKLRDTDVTDWKFVDFSEVPPGPWALYGENNTFVINRRDREEAVARARGARIENNR